MQNRDIPIHGFYMLGEKNDLSRNNIFTIQEFSGVKCLGELGIPTSIVDGKPFLQYIDTYFDTNESIKISLSDLASVYNFKGQPDPLKVVRAKR